MCTILLPIKPEYSNKIIEETKLYEYRKKRCKRKVNKILIYCTSPIKKIVAEVEVVDVLLNNPTLLWDITKEHAGISKKKYEEYYCNSNLAVAYKLGKVSVYDEPIDLRDIGINYHPQSYVYLD